MHAREVQELGVGHRLDAHRERLDDDACRSAVGGAPLPVLLVSFDPAHDDVAMLRKLAAEHHVQAPLFRLARPEQGDEGMLAGVLGIAYRPLPGGGYSHNVVVALLDARGRVLATTEASDAPDPAFVKAILGLHASR